MHVAIDRTENDPQTFREVLREFERGPKPLPNHPKPRDPKGRFTKKLDIPSESERH